MRPGDVGNADSPTESASPFLRWAGAKRRFVSALINFAPENYETYYEPFLGSGSMFFKIAPQNAVIGDKIEPLIRTFTAVRDDPQRVMEEIYKWTVDKESYYEIRSLQAKNKFIHAAQFIYLNKTCWNGLYRVNNSGMFNVPFGRPKSQNIANLENLVQCSVALKREIKILSGDFENALKGVKSNDFVFIDPPYVTQHKNQGFVDYNEKIFSWSDQIRLANRIKEIDRIGARFIVTNADHPSVRDLYADYSITSFERTSTIASSSAHRKKVTELIVTNQEQSKS